jgi:hypothetical protein
MTNPAVLGWLWGLLPGTREWLLVALVVVALYGRSSLVRQGVARLVRPWKTRSSGTNRPPKSAWLADHWFLLFAAIASSSVAAWIVTWMILAHRPPRP